MIVDVLEIYTQFRNFCRIIIFDKPAKRNRKLSFFPKKMTQMIGIDFEQPKTRYSVANSSITIELFSLKIQVMNLNLPIYWFNNRYLYKDKQEKLYYRICKLIDHLNKKIYIYTNPNPNFFFSLFNYCMLYWIKSW